MKQGGLAYCRKGYMFISHSKILQNAIIKERLQNSNKKLGRRGLVFAIDYYLAWIKLINWTAYCQTARCGGVREDENFI